jgi:hypothetical protein
MLKKVDATRIIERYACRACWGIVMRANLKKSPLLCDHCRGEVSVSIQRYWHMRFCSESCMAQYQARLSADTHKKILDLDVNRNLLRMAS